MSDWVDMTTYSRSRPRDETEPREWVLPLGSARIIVHRHVHYKERWMLSTVPRMFDNYVLESRCVDDAKAEAIAVVQTWLKRELDKINEVVGDE